MNWVGRKKSVLMAPRLIPAAVAALVHCIRGRPVRYDWSWKARHKLHEVFDFGLGQVAGGLVSHHLDQPSNLMAEGSEVLFRPPRKLTRRTGLNVVFS